MSRSKVFVCYSRQNAKDLAQLRTSLRPLEREGLLAVWDDTQVLAGGDWAEAIDREIAAAAAAVLLVSADFLSSDFVVERELPRLLAAAEDGRLTLIPVYLSPSLVEDLEIPFRDAVGDERRSKLTRFQGFGSPTRPLARGVWRGEVYWRRKERG